jgi:hypothetical protein
MHIRMSDCRDFLGQAAADDGAVQIRLTFVRHGRSVIDAGADGLPRVHV